MAEFRVYNPNTQIRGRMILDNIKAMGRSVKPILAKYGASELDPEGWYPQQIWLNILKDLSREGILDLMALGNRVANSYRLPDGVQSIANLRHYLDGAYQDTHRNPGPVEFTVEVLGPRALRIIDNSPYPDDFQFGIIFGLLERMMPLNANLRVRYNRTLPCRSNGADETAYVVTW